MGKYTNLALDTRHMAIRSRPHLVFLLALVIGSVLTVSLCFVDRFTHYNLSELSSHLLPVRHAHPLHGIIASARAEWDAKVARQSTTLLQAVQEYRRRYQHEPPAGFEKWWSYNQANHVGLPDEYDMIDTTIRPFLALSPEAFRERLQLAKEQSVTYVLAVKDGVMQDVVHNNDFRGVTEKGATNRAAGQTRFIEPIQQWLPDFEAVWSPHDTPRLVVKYEEKEALMSSPRAAFNESIEYYHPSFGWSATCPLPTNDTLYSSLSPSDLPTPPHPPPPASPPGTSSGYITDPFPTFNLCNSPLLTSHGAFASFRPHTMPLIPLFTLSTTALHSDILGIPYSHVQNGVPVPWENKSDARAVWRGSSTGGHYSRSSDWRKSQRFRLARLGMDKGEREVMMPDGEVMVMGNEEAVERYLDVGITGQAIQCSNDGTCAEITSETTFLPHLSQSAQVAFKSILDVDGNAWSARYRSLLQSGSVVVKSTVIPEWWTGRMAPWVHYVPLSLEYGEVFDIVAFFTEAQAEVEGGGQGLEGNGAIGENDAMAKQIGEAGKEWTERYWRTEDLVSWNFRLYLEYARLGKEPGEGDYVYDPAHEV